MMFRTALLVMTQFAMIVGAVVLVLVVTPWLIDWITRKIRERQIK